MLQWRSARPGQKLPLFDDLHPEMLPPQMGMPQGPQQFPLPPGFPGMPGVPSTMVPQAMPPIPQGPMMPPQASTMMPPQASAPPQALPPNLPSSFLHVLQMPH